MRGIAVRPGLLVFFRWEVGGVPLPLGRAAIQVQMTGDREAVAVYLKAERIP